MHILVINSGSSSVKFAVYETSADSSGSEPASLFHGEIAGIGGHAQLHFTAQGAASEQRAASASDAAEALHAVLSLLEEKRLPEIEAVGYRVVHPGAKLTGHQRITDDVLAKIEEAAAFAPLHDPAVVKVIQAGRERFPQLPQFACFDTVFHETMPDAAKTYPLALSLRDEGVRRYGFHGLSCESVVWRMQVSGIAVPPRMVIAHLGSGCSVTALEDGRSIDNSMGLTPDGGVVMGTRPGDLDPGLIFYLLRREGGSEEAATKAVEDHLNHHAGLTGMTGLENDMQVIRKAAEDGNADAVLALAVFTRSVRRAIGGCAWLLDGLDAIVFTGGIGEHDAATRQDVLGSYKGFGVSLDEAKNTAEGKGLRTISAGMSKTKIYIIPAEEELTIARHVEAMMLGTSQLG